MATATGIFVSATEYQQVVELIEPRIKIDLCRGVNEIYMDTTKAMARLNEIAIGRGLPKPGVVVRFRRLLRRFAKPDGGPAVPRRLFSLPLSFSQRILCGADALGAPLGVLLPYRLHQLGDCLAQGRESARHVLYRITHCETLP